MQYVCSYIHTSHFEQGHSLTYMIPSHFLLRAVTHSASITLTENQKKARNSAALPSTKQKPPRPALHDCGARKRGTSACAVSLCRYKADLLTTYYLEHVRDVVATQAHRLCLCQVGQSWNKRAMPTSTDGPSLAVARMAESIPSRARALSDRSSSLSLTSR
ncbi:hypothetical protein LX32DRAFT_414573 [Colletotrichum zoysiae]|uniref:Uncharacterized protein n=1 Tax=Colletotrichum zoysiae TaxID=1216348 RepID=A0AAD9HHH0_9PEZI|nr:hypothetical protein LX32DRAFT_414573 [Colletotrichum zoysiae]